jgi:putative transposase
VQTEGKRVKLPVIGWVAMREEVRLAGRILSVTISRQADAWYASFSIDVEYEPEVRTDATVVGVDLGITALATLSDGTPKVRAPKPLRRYLQKLKRLARGYSRTQRGSNNRAKAKTKLARLHRRIADIRADVLHQLTTSLTRYATIVIEDLNVSGMLANRRLSRAIADVGFFEFRRQLEYKAAMAGSRVIIADRWFASSKICSACSVKNEALTLSERTWTCLSCGTSLDRDVNAARNLARYAESSPASACGADGSGGEDHLAVKPAA